MELGAQQSKIIGGVEVYLQRPINDYHDRLTIFDQEGEKFVPFTLDREEGIWRLFAIKNAIRHAKEAFK